MSAEIVTLPVIRIERHEDQSEDQLREALRVIRDHAVWEHGEGVEALRLIIDAARDVAAEALA